LKVGIYTMQKTLYTGLILSTWFVTEGDRDFMLAECERSTEQFSNLKSGAHH